MQCQLGGHPGESAPAATMQKRSSPPSMSSPAWAVRRQTFFVGVAPALLRVVPCAFATGEGTIDVLAFPPEQQRGRVPAACSL
jgi:hypothetical protein